MYCCLPPLDSKVSPLAKAEGSLAALRGEGWARGTEEGCKTLSEVIVCVKSLVFISFSSTQTALQSFVGSLYFASWCCFFNHCSLSSVARNFLFTFYYNGLFKMTDRSLFSWPKTRLALNVGQVRQIKRTDGICLCHGGWPFNRAQLYQIPQVTFLKYLLRQINTVIVWTGRSPNSYLFDSHGWVTFNQKKYF